MKINFVGIFLVILFLGVMAQQEGFFLPQNGDSEEISDFLEDLPTEVRERLEKELEELPSDFNTNDAQVISDSDIPSESDYNSELEVVGQEEFDKDDENRRNLNEDNSEKKFADKYGDGYVDGHGDGYIDGHGDGYEDGLRDSHEIGYHQGYNDGFIDGHDQGHDYGFENGYNHGYGDGLNDGQDLEFWPKDGEVEIFGGDIIIIDGEDGEIIIIDGEGGEIIIIDGEDGEIIIIDECELWNQHEWFDLPGFDKDFRDMYIPGEGGYGNEGLPPIQHERDIRVPEFDGGFDYQENHHVDMKIRVSDKFLKEILLYCEEHPGSERCNKQVSEQGQVVGFLLFEYMEIFFAEKLC